MIVRLHIVRTQIIKKYNNQHSHYQYHFLFPSHDCVVEGIIVPTTKEKVVRVIHRELNIVGKKNVLILVGLSSALTATVKRNIIELVIGEEFIMW